MVQVFLSWGISGLTGCFLLRAPEKTARPQADGRLQGKTSLSPAQENLLPFGLRRPIWTLIFRPCRDVRDPEAPDLRPSPLPFGKGKRARAPRLPRPNSGGPARPRQTAPQ